MLTGLLTSKIRSIAAVNLQSGLCTNIVELWNLRRSAIASDSSRPSGMGAHLLVDSSVICQPEQGNWFQGKHINGRHTTSELTRLRRLLAIRPDSNIASLRDRISAVLTVWIRPPPEQKEKRRHTGRLLAEADLTPAYEERQCAEYAKVRLPRTGTRKLRVVLCSLLSWA